MNVKSGTRLLNSSDEIKAGEPDGGVPRLHAPIVSTAIAEIRQERMRVLMAMMGGTGVNLMGGYENGSHSSVVIGLH